MTHPRIGEAQWGRALARSLPAKSPTAKRGIAARTHHFTVREMSQLVVEVGCGSALVPRCARPFGERGG